MFTAYVPFGSVAAGATVTQDFNIPLATFNVSGFGFKANVSTDIVVPVLLQVGLWNGSTWTPFATLRGTGAETLAGDWPLFFHDGTQQVRISITNLGASAANIYADCSCV